MSIRGYPGVPSKLIGIALLLCWTAGSSSAQAPKDVLTWDGDVLTIKGRVMAPEACYAAGAASSGAPAGATAVEDAALVTVPITRTSTQMCAQVVTPVSFTATVKVPQNANAVIVYTVHTASKAVFARAVALPARPR